MSYRVPKTQRPVALLGIIGLVIVLITGCGSSAPSDTGAPTWPEQHSPGIEIDGTQMLAHQIKDVASMAVRIGLKPLSLIQFDSWGVLVA